MTQITSGDFDDSEPAWSPDGKLLAFTSNRSKPDPDLTYNSDIWVVAADNTDKGAHLTQVTTNPGCRHLPRLVPRRQVDHLRHPARSQALRLRHQAHRRLSRHRRRSQAFSLSPSIASASPRASRPTANSSISSPTTTAPKTSAASPVTGGEITRPVAGRLMVNDYSLAKTGDLVAQIATIDRPDELYRRLRWKTHSASPTPTTP